MGVVEEWGLQDSDSEGEDETARWGDDSHTGPWWSNTVVSHWRRGTQHRRDEAMIGYVVCIDGYDGIDSFFRDGI